MSAGHILLKYVLWVVSLKIHDDRICDNFKSQ
jgi:hypothetical protein